MKIVAYSKVPSATPFVHLGYLAASTTTIKPIQGLLVGGLLLLLAGLSVAGQRLSKRRRQGQTTEVADRRSPRFGLIGSAVILTGVVAIGCAFAFGHRDRVYTYPEEATSTRVDEFWWSIARAREPGNSTALFATLPTQEGEYELFSASGQPARYRERFMDGWNTPLILRAVQKEGQLKYLVVSTGPDRILGTQDDITAEGQEPKLIKREAGVSQ